MLYIFYGRDTFSLRRALVDLKASLDSDGMLESNTSLLDGRQLSPEELMAVCDTVPFLAAQRLVVVEGLLARFEASGRAGRRRDKSATGGEGLGPWRVLPEYVDRLPPTTTLVLVDEDVSLANPLLAALRPKAKAQHFPPLHPREVPAWIQRRASEIGLALSSRAVTVLANLVGNDLWLLASEMDKLAAYANGQRLDEADVRALVGAAREVSIFALVDAIVEGRPQQALRLLRQAIAQGADYPYLFAMVLRQYRNLVLARELLDQGERSADIGERLGIRAPFALEKLLDQAERYEMPRLVAAYRRLLAADVAVKRGIYSDELALELLLQDLAAT